MSLLSSGRYPQCWSRATGGKVNILGDGKNLFLLTLSAWPGSLGGGTMLPARPFPGETKRLCVLGGRAGGGG